MDLKGKIVVITGATEGLGLAFAHRIAARGARIFGLARSMPALDRARAQLGAAFVPLQCDVTVEGEVRAAFDAVSADEGRLDVLLNNAGVGRFGAVDELQPGDWAAQVETNLTGVFLCTRLAVPLMKAQNVRHGFGGHIVNIASIAGLVGNPNLSAYNATKFGLRGFSEALMKEVRAHGIKVTCVCPGSVATEFGRRAGSKGAPNPMHPDDIASTVVHVLEASPNYLISEVVMRPLRPKG